MCDQRKAFAQRKHLLTIWGGSHNKTNEFLSNPKQKREGDIEKTKDNLFSQFAPFSYLV